MIEVVGGSFRKQVREGMPNFGKIGKIHTVWHTKTVLNMDRSQPLA